MSKSKKMTYLCLAWFFVGLGLIGVILPVVPTTPFLILALALFSKCSPRFHKMLLNNPILGPDLKRWKENRSISKQSKIKAYILVIITFSVSIYLMQNLMLKTVLFTCLILLLRFLYKLKVE